MNKILFVCYDGYRTTNTRVRCYRFANELSKSGMKAEVFSFKDNLHARYEGLESYKAGFFERLSLLIKAVKRLSKEDRGTVFYIQKSGYFALAPLFVHLIKGNRLILDYDDYEYEQSSISRPILRGLAKSSIFCVAASSYLQDFLKRFNSKVYYIPTGVDTELFKPKKRQKSKTKQVVFAWTGFIVDKAALENLMFIIDCFEELTAKHKEILLEIVGGGICFEEVLARLEKIGSSRIFYKGKLPPDKVPDYLSGVDVGLFVLVRPTKYNLSKSPTKLFEYMAKGIPVISTCIGESGRIVEHSKNGMLAANKQEFIKCTEQLAENRGLRNRLGRQAYLSAKKDYSLEVLGKQLSEIIQKECG